MERMKHFVDTGTTVRVSVTDGRVFTGTLGCVDKQLNVVLINATETFKKKKKSKRGGKEKEKRENEEKEEENNRDDDVETSSSSSPRVINMALIAREHRVKMERLEVEREEKEKEKEEANTESLLESALDKGLRIL
jgi:small nuclear ribonucleoprotein (snRNP)-like protein